MEEFYKLFVDVNRILEAPRDEKNPFDNLYDALAILKPISIVSSMSGYAASAQAARICVDCLESAELRNYIKLCTDFEENSGNFK